MNDTAQDRSILKTMGGKLIPRRTLFGGDSKLEPRISPDGECIAYVSRAHGTLNICLRATHDGKERCFSLSNVQRVHYIIWQADSNHLLYSFSSDGDERMHIYQFDCRSGRSINLTPFAGSRVRFVGKSTMKPDEMLFASNHREPSVLDVYRVRLSTREVWLEMKNDGWITDWFADENLEIKAYIISEGTRRHICARVSVTAPWKTVQSWAVGDRPGTVLGISADGVSIRMLSAETSNTMRLVEVNLTTGEQTTLFEDKVYDVDSVMQNPRTGVLEAVCVVRERKEWEIVDKCLRKDLRRLRRKCHGEIRIVSRDADLRFYCVVDYADNRSPRFLLYDRRDGDIRLLFVALPGLKKYELATTTPIAFEARDGLKLHGYLTKPVACGLHAPAVVLVHSGPWARDVWGYDPVVQFLANRGYVVLQVNYRGSTGYGTDHLRAGDREWGGNMQNDLVDLKRWAVEHNYVSSSRVAVMGTSYGGYAALVGITHTPGEFACAIAASAPSNLLTLISGLPKHWSSMRSVIGSRIGNAETEQTMLRQRSPAFAVQAIAAPLLLCHGARDVRISVEDSDRYVASLHEAGKQETYIVYPDEGHVMSDPANQVSFYGEVERFLKQHLGGRAQTLVDRSN